jgi:hypothetical protein
MTIETLARKTIELNQGALMSGSEIKRLARWIEVQTTWERLQFVAELQKQATDRMRGERRL